jgi:hypothetical protein
MKHKFERKHVTTIAGPQAEAILASLDDRKAWTYIDKSVPGCPVVEIWSE